MNNLLLVLGLGLAGIDPVGMMLLIAAMTAGASKKQIYLYGLLVLAGTTILGLTLSAILGAGFAQITSHIEGAINSFSDRTWTWISFVIIAVLLYFASKRLLAKDKKEEGAGAKGGKGLIAGAGFMVFTAITDPTFIALMGLAGQVNNLALSILYSLLWTLISQASLFLLIGAVIFGKHEIFIDKFNRFYQRYKIRIDQTITGLLFLLALVFIADLVYFWLTGIWLIG